MAVKVPTVEGLVTEMSVMLIVEVVTIVKYVTVTRLPELTAVQLVDPLDMQPIVEARLK